MQRRIGIYAGTFDPVHPGHLAFAVETARQCQLDEMLFLPEREPRAKQGVTDISHRVALLERATQNMPDTRVIQLDSPQFTIATTLPEIRSLTGDAKLTLLIGSDIVPTLPRWEHIHALLKDTVLAIGVRTGDNVETVLAALQELERLYGKPVQHTLIYTAEADLTSSLIRNGTGHRERLHPALLSYIQKHSLYT